MRVLPVLVLVLAVAARLRSSKRPHGVAPRGRNLCAPNDRWEPISLATDA